jgi:acyl carrier protein
MSETPAVVAVADVVALISRIGKMTDLAPEQDFYEAGFSSVSALELLLEMEATFGVAIPDDRFITARTPLALQTLVVQLQEEQGS